MLSNGINVDGFSFRIEVSILSLICDAPAIAKTCNCNQYNGYYGCIHCLHPALKNTKPSKMIYPYSINHAIRTNHDYNFQVQKSIETKSVFQGIKGPCWISKYIKIPDNIYLDPMHLIYIGTQLKLLTMWCTEFKNFQNEINSFYLGPKKRSKIDEIILKLDYPNEISRNQRSINDLKNFKANEFRNLMFYYGPTVFKEVMKKSYFMHYATYATSIRLMVQKKISKEDLNDAFILMNYFIKRFSQIYGAENMDYKLHAHSHLPLQVLSYGPLNLLSCFSFEGEK